jgi:hypothetical protein
MYAGYSKIYPEMPVLSGSLLEEVEHKAYLGLSREEITSGLSITYDFLTETEQKYFDERFNYGVMMGKESMLKALHSQANQRNGGQIAIAFLRRYAENWKGEDGGASDSGFFINFMKS